MALSKQFAIQSWLKRFSTSDLPIFSQTVREVSGVAAQHQSSASDLARAIGRDAALAARLLKIANSPIFNLQHNNIDTISSAVVMIGFDAIRELAVSLTLIEQVLKGNRHARVTQTMARAFHAAAQARSFADCRGDQCPEEVFVAALLYQVGEMAFWSVAELEAQAIDRMTRSGASLTDAEQRVLGFRLPELTACLVDEWQLGGLLEHAVRGNEGGERVDNVVLGHEVAATVEQFGWASSEVREVLAKVASHLNLGYAEVEALVQGNVENAARIASRYGVTRVEEFICDPKQSDASVTEATSTPAIVASAGPDPVQELKALKQVAVALESGSATQELARLVLTGIREGVGFDRAFLGFPAEAGTSLLIKHEVGGIPRGAVPMGGKGPKNLLDVVFESGKALHISADRRSSVAELIDGHIERWVAEEAFVMMPIVVGERTVGLLYADNQNSGRPIDDEAFAGFRHFGHQLALSRSF